MKSFAAIATLAAVSSAFDAEFMRGAQTGMFIRSEEQFEEYSCPASELSPQIQQMINMALPMKMMAQNMNKGEPNALVDAAFEGLELIGHIQGIFNEDYDGGEFCKGLLFAKEASTVIFKVGGKLMNQGKSKDEDDTVSMKATSMEEKFRRM